MTFAWGLDFTGLLLAIGLSEPLSLTLLYLAHKVKPKLGATRVFLDYHFLGFALLWWGLALFLMGAQFWGVCIATSGLDTTAIEFAFDQSKHRLGSRI